MITFPTAATWSGYPKFSADAVLNGSAPNPEERGEPGRIWIEVDGVEDCLRFYGVNMSTGSQPLIYLEGDASRRDGNGWALFDGYTSQSPAALQSWAEQVAIATHRPFITLARPGVYGSSGCHQHRRRPREVALVNAALTMLKQAFSWSRLDLAGMSGGGHLVACLIARRSDVDCAVIASGNVAVRQRNTEQLRLTDVTGFMDFLDPIDLVSEVARHPPQSVIVLTDPQDRVVSLACQQAYVEALVAAGVRVDYRTLPALDGNHHFLRDAALLAACSRP